MSRTANCIKMLQILNTGRIYKISDLSSILDTNPRNIIEYKKELEECNYYIDTIPGRYGGYKLNKSDFFPSLKLNDNEINAIKISLCFLENNKEYLQKVDYLTAISKILSSLNNADFITTNYSYISRFPLSMSTEDLSLRYSIISSAIVKQNVLEINYLSNDNKYRLRKIHPYTLYIYNNAWFVIAWCELAADFRYFKLCRIKQITNTTTHFTKHKYYDEHEYINSFGMTKNGEWYDIKLKFTGIAAMYIKDNVYGKNQVIEECEDGSTILSVKMQYKDSITKFVLYFGNECEVLEPQWLISDLLNTINTLKQNYENK